MSREAVLAHRTALASRLRQEPGKLENGELYWVTAPMVRWALDASTDLPAEFVPSEHMPALAGLIAYEAGLPPLHVSGLEDITDPMPVRALSWTVADVAGDMELHLGAWAHTEDLTAEQLDILRGIEGETAGAWHRVVGTSVMLHEAVGSSQYDPEDESALYLLAATWVLMQTPTMADVRPLPGRAGKGSKARRRAPAPPREVKLVDLRRLVHRPTEPGETDAQGREYRHRWVVRGHWRQHAYGPGQKLRRTQWIPPFIKGPEGAPLLPTEHVNVWRR